MSTTAFILIIATWGNTGPTYAMQEFASAEACHAAEQLVLQHMIPPRDMSVITRCVAKT
jgi:hypothetical protein